MRENVTELAEQTSTQEACRHLAYPRSSSYYRAAAGKASSGIEGSNPITTSVATGGTGSGAGHAQQ
ncbi:MAG: hypothetical protein H6667_21430 [Ardenticatenaceae bacterium]|nr:hypothetical protein [Ardenticatenaceae bacterium]